MEVSIVTFPANDHAKISHITKQISHLISKENKMDSELENKNGQFKMKINELEEKMYNIENFLSRTDMQGIANNEHKTAFNNYIRQGNQGDFHLKLPVFIF